MTDYEQGDLLALTSASKCDDCGRRLKTQHSRDRGLGPKCWKKAHPDEPHTNRGGAWWHPQTGPGLIEAKGTKNVPIRTVTSQYTISAAPENRDRHYAVTVDRRITQEGSAYWVVLHLGYYLGSDGTWSVGPESSAAADEWWSSRHFDLETALRYAEVAAPDVEVNGRRARDL